MKEQGRGEVKGAVPETTVIFWEYADGSEKAAQGQALGSIRLSSIGYRRCPLG